MRCKDKLKVVQQETIENEYKKAVTENPLFKKMSLYELVAEQTGFSVRTVIRTVKK